MQGNINAGTDVNCGDVEGSINAGINVVCADVGGKEVIYNGEVEGEISIE